MNTNGEQEPEVRPMPRLVVKVDSEPELDLQMEHGGTLLVEYHKGLPTPGDKRSEPTSLGQVPPDHAKQPPERPSVTSFVSPFPQDPVRKEVDGSLFSKQSLPSSQSLKERIRASLVSLDEEDVKDFVCFKLDLKWDDLPGQGKQGKVRGLIEKYESLRGEEGLSRLFQKVTKFMGELQQGYPVA